ncbi:protein-disulfide reductase DsbD domain-containing protein [Arenimonas sp.]|uniref:protein-disulfide reductase DsbD domain-containing protein n=1 Tax=Arenimonas sp. TaxID=1872635 RepID=UPI0039E249A1
MTRSLIPQLSFALLAAWLASAGAFAAGSGPVQTDHLRSRLVAETSTAVPGSRLTLGLLLEHDPHWHTYWRNPGDSGLPTRLDLTLPPGVVAAPIAWPHPERFEISGIVNFGYSGRHLLPVIIAIPADYAALTLPVRVKARWLICEENCIPGKAEYALDLPVRRTAEPDRQWQGDFATARRDQPSESPAVLTIAEDGDAMLLTLSGLDAAAMPVAWQWFPETPELVANGAHPQWRRTADTWQARWSKSEYFTTLPAEVAMVAVEDEGVARRFVARLAAPAAHAAALPAPTTTPALTDKKPVTPRPSSVMLYALSGGLILVLMLFAWRRKR